MSSSPPPGWSTSRASTPNRRRGRLQAAHARAVQLDLEAQPQRPAAVHRARDVEPDGDQRGRLRIPGAAEVEPVDSDVEVQAPAFAGGEPEGSEVVGVRAPRHGSEPSVGNTAARRAVKTPCAHPARDLHLLSAAVGLSALGDWLALVALALHVEANIGSSFALAALFFALWSPSVLLAGPAGLLADRVESRALLIAGSLVAAAACAGLAFAAASSRSSRSPWCSAAPTPRSHRPSSPWSRPSPRTWPRRTPAWRRRATSATPPARCSAA